MMNAPARLPKRELDSHKGTYGRVLVVAGSRGMAGAAVLCGSGALRGGAGLVRVACPWEVQDNVAVGNPCYTTVGIAHDPKGWFFPDACRQLISQVTAVDTLAIGPGLLVSPAQAAFLRELIESSAKFAKVIDASGLQDIVPALQAVTVRKAPIVLTPHPGEFAKMLGVTTEEVQANRESLAVTFAQTHRVILVLKGHRTIVTDGTQTYINTTGNPGMATGGSGDVLTGLIASLLCTSLSAFEATTLGVWVHGRAGDLAADEVGQTGMIASDILAYLPKALREVE